MPVRRGASLVALMVLAACGQSSTNYAPAAPAGAPALHAATAGPAFGLRIELPKGVLPNTQVNFGSFKAISKVKTRTYVYLIKTVSLCPITDTNGSVAGCEIYATNTQTYDVKEAVFEFYSKPDEKGCLLARGTYKGNIGPGWALTKEKAENQKTCW